MAVNYLSGNVSTAIDTQRVLEVKILNRLNAISGGGAGGGGVDCGAGAPVAAPSSTCALYIDTNDGTLYEYYSGAWH